MNSDVCNKKLNVALIYNLKPARGKNPSSNNYLYSTTSNVNEGFNDVEDDKYAEWDTEETIFAVRDAIETKHNVIMIEANKNIFEKLLNEKIDVAFNIAEGLYGNTREAQVPAILDYLNIPYTGSDAATLSICLEKSRAKEILSFYNIPTAKFIVTDTKINSDNFNLEFPLFVKPNLEGSSKGIFKTSYVNNIEELNSEIDRIRSNYNQKALVEEFLSGREFTVGVLGNNGSAKVLPIIEILHSALPKDFIPIYSYEAKWIYDHKDSPLDIFKCPADITNDLKLQIEKISLDAYRVLNCKDWTRIDIRLDKNGNPNIIELNPLPGILPDPKDNSCFPKAARTAGIGYNEMILQVLNEAIKRYGI